MKEFDDENILAQIAEKHGTTPEQVRAEIERVIDHCWNSRDPRVREIWKSIRPDGQKPTAEEAILHLSVLVFLVELVTREEEREALESNDIAFASMKTKQRKDELGTPADY